MTLSCCTWIETGPFKKVFLWLTTLVALFSVLFSPSQAAVTVVPHAEQAAAEINQIWYGIYSPHPQGNVFFINYFDGAASDGKYYLEAYREDGSTPGRIAHPIKNAEGVAQMGTKLVILGKVKGVMAFNIQSITNTQVVFNIDSTLSDPNLDHDKGYAKITYDSDSNYFYSVIYRSTPWVLMGPDSDVRTNIFKIDPTDLSSVTEKVYKTGKKNIAYNLFHWDSNRMLLGARKKIYIVEKGTLNLIRRMTDEERGTFAYWMTMEPLDPKIWYVGESQFTAPLANIAERQIQKVNMETYTGTQAECLGIVKHPTAYSNYLTDFTRLPYFRVLVFHNQGRDLYLVDIDVFTFSSAEKIHRFPSGIHKTLFWLGKVERRAFYFSMVLDGSHKMSTVKLILDYCEGTENPCTKCISGRYLEETGVLDNRCLLPSEFPPGYGISDSGSFSGLAIAPCFGDLALGCLKCPSSLTTCTECDNSKGFYINTYAGDICQKIPQFPDEYGLDIPTSKVEPCSDSNCLKCQADRTKCSVCKTTYFLKEGTDSGCVTNTLSNYGLKSSVTPNVLAPCQVANCKECKADYTQCTGCSTNYYFKQGVANQCFENNIAGYGLDLTQTPALIRPCSVDHCSACLPDFSSCTACSSPYYLTATKTCSEGEPGKGPDANGHLVSCAVTHCFSCSTNYLLCDQCDSSYFLKEGTQYQKICLENNQDYFGLKPFGTQKVLASCQVTDCQTCFADYSKCEQCVTGKYPLEEDRGVCLLNNIPGKGLNIISGKDVISPCADTNCADCLASSKICVACKTNYFFRTGFETSIPACFKNDSPGWGKDLSTAPNLKLSSCVIENCGSCFDDHTVCKACGTDFYRLMPENTCVENNIPGKGPKLVDLSTVPASTEWRLTPCELDKCLHCYTGVGKCTKCIKDHIYDAVNTKQCVLNNKEGFGNYTDENGHESLETCRDQDCSNCVLDVEKCLLCKSSNKKAFDGICKYFSKEMISVQVQHFSTKTDTYSLRFSQIIDNEDFQNNLNFKLRTGSNNILVQESKYSLRFWTSSTTTYTTLYCKMSANDQIAPSTLEISHRDKSNPVFKNVLNSFNPEDSIFVRGITFSPLASGSLLSAAQTTLKGVTMGAAALGGGNSGHLTPFLKLIDSIEHVLFLNGLRAVRADHFLHMLNIDILQILPNVFKIPESRLNCIPAVNFYREELTCSFLNNAGSNIFTVLCFGMMVVFVLILEKFLGEKLKKKGKFFALLISIPKRFFSVSLFLALFDGDQIEIFRLALLAWTASKGFNTYLAIDKIAAMLILMIYFVYIWMLHCYIKTALVKPQQKPRFSFMADLFIDFKPKNKNAKGLLQVIHFYVPVIFVLKTFVSQLLVTAMVNLGLVEIWLLIGIELSYCGYLLLFRPFKKRWNNIGAIITSFILFIIHLILLIISLSPSAIDFNDRETTVSLILICLYSTVVLLSLIPLIFQALSVVFVALKKKCSKKKSQPAVLPINPKNKSEAKISKNKIKVQISPSLSSKLSNKNRLIGEGSKQVPLSVVTKSTKSVKRSTYLSGFTTNSIGKRLKSIKHLPVNKSQAKFLQSSLPGEPENLSLTQGGTQLGSKHSVLQSSRAGVLEGSSPPSPSPRVPTLDSHTSCRPGHFLHHAHGENHLLPTLPLDKRIKPRTSFLEPKAERSASRVPTSKVNKQP